MSMKESTLESGKEACERKSTHLGRGGGAGSRLGSCGGGCGALPLQLRVLRLQSHRRSFDLAKLEACHERSSAHSFTCCMSSVTMTRLSR